MTGEITLAGLVFPVGGIKGKVLAARRAGMKRVALPHRNEPDLKDVPEEALKDLQIVFVDHIDELLEQTLEPKRGDAPIPAEEPEPHSVAVEAGTEGPQARA